MLLVVGYFSGLSKSLRSPSSELCHVRCPKSQCQRCVEMGDASLFDLYIYIYIAYIFIRMQVSTMIINDWEDDEIPKNDGKHPQLSTFWSGLDGQVKRVSM